VLRSTVFLVLASTGLLGPLTAFAQSERNQLTPPERSQLIDRAVPPERIADAIVDFVPSRYMPLHVPSPNRRTLEGTVIKLERGPTEPFAIVHTAKTMITPLAAGEPVKLFLKLDPSTNEYYLIAVLPVSYKYGELK
jgi:hypothetical protein